MINSERDMDPGNRKSRRGQFNGLTPAAGSILVASLAAAGESTPFPFDPAATLERTCFQTAAAWSANGNLRSDVAIVYGIDPGLPARIETWRKRGYRIHVMTGVSWGQYQDYLYGRFDGVNHWEDYRVNWESTLTASLLQPDVWRYEVAPWPERVFGRSYPKKTNRSESEPIPPAYATELQTVFNALNDMKQSKARWDCGTPRLGVLVSDSLMFQRGEPTPSDPHLSHVFGLAMPLLKRGMPVTPVQLENVIVPGYLKNVALLLLSYQGQKPLSQEIHTALAAWVRAGGALIVWDDDSDPYNRVREWWNSDGRAYATPREHLFEQLGLASQAGSLVTVGQGVVWWQRENPVQAAANAEAEARLIAAVQAAAARVKLPWRETNYLLLERGPYVIAAGLDESVAGEPKNLRGRFVSLFDPELGVCREIAVAPGTRLFLLDLDKIAPSVPTVLASACKALPVRSAVKSESRWQVEGVACTPAVVLIHSPLAPTRVTLAGAPLDQWRWDPAERLAWVHFSNTSDPRDLVIGF
jgi:hypothetical protein